MIKGRIELYKEPPRTRYSNSTWSPAYMDGYESFQPESMTDYDRMKRSLETLLEAATKAGYVVGARVRKTYGYALQGTITRIHDTLGMAKNYRTNSLEPFVVDWDATGDYKQPASPMSYTEIVLVQPPTLMC